MTSDLLLRPGMPVLAQMPDNAAAARHIERMRGFGTNIAGYVTEGSSENLPGDKASFATFAEAAAATAAEACLSFSTRHKAADAALEAARAGVKLIVTTTRGVPIHDILRVHRHIRDLGATWIGAATSGLARPSAGLLLGTIPGAALAAGSIALVTDSGNLGAEAGVRMREAGMGQSLYLDIGPGPVKGTRMAALPEFIASDPETRAVALLESPFSIGDDDFYTGIQILARKKPVMAYIPDPAALHPSARSVPHHPQAPAFERRATALAASGVTVYNSLGALIAALKAAA